MELSIQACAEARWSALRFGGRILTHLLFTRKASTRMQKRAPAASLILALFLMTFAAAVRADNARETPLVKAIRRARPAVVNIHSEKTVPYTPGDPTFGTTPTRGRKINGMGTGIIIDERGYIITNHHVVNGVDSLRVTLDNGGNYEATIVSEDPVRDLALLKIQSREPLTVMPLGTSSDLMLGETVFAVGNAFGYENTITVGIISALHRDVEVNDTQSYKNLIQTDAAINPGNSGGPLINVNGEIVGINVAIRAGAQKIGFAIPIDDARRVMADLMKIEYFDGTYHGLVGRDVKNTNERKLVVESARPGSPAEMAGLKPADVILRAGDYAVNDEADFERALLGHRVGDEISMIVKREGKTETVSLKLAAATGELAAIGGTGNIVVHGLPGTVAAASSQSSDLDADSQRIWDVVGIRVLKIARSNPSLLNSKYEGGLQVLSIRPDSPAARSGIQPRDVLVGLDRYQTVKSTDVSWVLDHHETEYVRFHVYRANDTLYGDMALSMPAR
jgi:serine protease Do